MRDRLGMRAIGLFALSIALSVSITTAAAAVAASDVQVAARVVSFMENPPTGTVRVGIVYAPGDPQSSADAAKLQQTLGSGLRAGNLVLLPVMVKADEIAGASVGLFFLTEGVGAAAATVGEAARARRVPCITVDLVQVRAGACAVGVRSEPRVEILVNRAAATSSGITFSTAFRMLITEF